MPQSQTIAYQWPQEKEQTDQVHKPQAKEKQSDWIH